MAAQYKDITLVQSAHGFAKARKFVDDYVANGRKVDNLLNVLICMWDKYKETGQAYICRGAFKDDTEQEGVINLINTKKLVYLDLHMELKEQRYAKYS